MIQAGSGFGFLLGPPLNNFQRNKLGLASDPGSVSEIHDEKKPVHDVGGLSECGGEIKHKHKARCYDKGSEEHISISVKIVLTT